MYQRQLIEVNKLCEQLQSQIDLEDKNDVVGSQSKHGKHGKKKSTTPGSSSCNELESVADSSGLVQMSTSKKKKKGKKAQIPDSESKEVVLSDASKNTVEGSTVGSSGISLEEGSAQKRKNVLAGSNVKTDGSEKGSSR